MNAQQFNALLSEEIPLANFLNIRALRIDVHGSSLELIPTPRANRPDARLSGPALFTLVDLAMYAAVLGSRPDQISALTTEIDLRFLRKPPNHTLTATGSIMSIDGRSCVLSCVVTPDNDPDYLICHSTATYWLSHMQSTRAHPV